ncbi:hypothetical protein QE152_g6432 [Popillia japonica]|uniref:C2H2-type domain-containing protein n=1 Tax=Popillia japonica TaxID=7064 RepID=A0AAW1MIX0_POPJA
MANRRFGGPQRGGRGFLPNANVNPWQGNTGPATNNLNSSNLQTQLALALSSLLQPQQVNEPPSLLSLNTSPGNFNQDNYSNRLGPRGRSDFRRSEPYNKNQRSGWRNDRSHNRAGPMSRARSNAKDKNASKDKAKPDKKSSDKVSNDVSQKSDKDKDEKQVDNVDENRDEEGGDTKRDWKEEKNTSEDKKESGDEKGKEDGDKEKGDRSKYAGLYNSLFHCFVCNKSMWDADSFKNHIRGRAHIQMMDSLEESFQITVKILRENMRLSEEKKMIEWNRMQRNNRKFHNRNEPESHCNMCDLKFVGKIIAHRKTEGHQRLKRFLHPNCDTCNLEFPSRMEWVEHRFTPEHLFKVKEILDSQAGDTEGHIIEENLEWENEPLLQENLQTEDENPVLELDDDLSNLYNRVPVYNPNRPVGKNSLQPAEGFFCDVCKRFLRNESDSQNHLKSEKHYHEFVMAVKSKFRANVEKAEEEGKFKRKKNAEGEEEEEKEETEEDKKAENGDDMYDPEEACKEGGEGEEEEKNENEASEKKDDDVAEDKGDEKAEDDKKIKQEEEDDDVIMESESKAVSSPTPRRRGAVKNGAEEEDDDVIMESESKAVSSPTPRRRGAVKNGAGPKSKKVRK